jgi:hypothetical protein
VRDELQIAEALSIERTAEMLKIVVDQGQALEEKRRERELQDCQATRELEQLSRSIIDAMEKQREGECHVTFSRLAPFQLL